MNNIQINKEAEYLEKLYPECSKLKNNRKIILLFKKKYPNAFRCIGMIEEIHKNSITIKITKCNHFKNNDYKPDTITIYKVPEKIMNEVEIDKMFSGYCHLHLFGPNYKFCYYSNSHNKIRFNRFSDYDQYFDDIFNEDDE